MTFLFGIAFTIANLAKKMTTVTAVYGLHMGGKTDPTSCFLMGTKGPHHENKKQVHGACSNAVNSRASGLLRIARLRHFLRDSLHCQREDEPMIKVNVYC